MANQWFKLFGGEYLGDQKILSLSAAERSCWITLLCYASQSDGVVKFLTEERLMIHAGVAPGEPEWEKTKGVLKKFQDLEMVEMSNGAVTLKNWKKRQDSYLSNAERQKRYRDRNGQRNARYKKVTLEQNRIEENRIEKKKRKRDIAAVAAPQPQKVEKKPKDPNEPLSLEQYVASMRTSPHRFIRLIGEYADEVRPALTTRGQWEVFTTRNVRVAKQLSPFTDDQIAAAMSELESNLRTKKNPKGYITTWGMETILKYLTK